MLLGRGIAGAARRAFVGRVESGRERLEDRIEPRSTASSGPPIIRQKPRSRPKTPPLVPQSM